MKNTLLIRTVVALLLLPIGLAVIALGGVTFALVIALILGIASYEFTKLFEAAGHQPALYLVIPGTLLIVAGRYLDGFSSAGWIISLILLVLMTFHLVSYERGRDRAASDYAISVSAIFYVGWLGAYLVSIREMQDGFWWLLIVLPSVWLADSGAYLVGSKIGRHRMSPRLSPKKTWEGYWGGVVVGTIGAVLLAYFWRQLAGESSAITPLRGAILGLTISVLTTLGDLGESMLKRNVGAKDSGHLLPGHGGALDRIDSWLWAGPLGYYLICYLFQ